MAVKFEATDYKKITLDEMLDFIEQITLMTRRGLRQ